MCLLLWFLLWSNLLISNFIWIVLYWMHYFGSGYFEDIARSILVLRDKYFCSLFLLYVIPLYKYTIIYWCTLMNMDPQILSIWGVLRILPLWACFYMSFVYICISRGFKSNSEIIGSSSLIFSSAMSNLLLSHSVYFHFSHCNLLVLFCSLSPYIHIHPFHVSTYLFEEKVHYNVFNILVY